MTTHNITASRAVSPSEAGEGRGGGGGRRESPSFSSHISTKRKGNERCFLYRVGGGRDTGACASDGGNLNEPAATQ